MNETELILTDILDCDRVDLYVRPRVLSPDQQKKFQKMKDSRAKGEPIQYILGYCDFMGLKFQVDHRVLIPRPETEIMVDFLIEKLDHLDSQVCILDLGTGSGNISIALAKNLPNVSITSVDISPQAIDLARLNARTNHVDDKIIFVCEDMKTFLLDQQNIGTFDIVISNPPYIRTKDMSGLPADVRREPESALDGGVDGLDFYRVIIEHAPRVMKQKGLVICEIGDDLDMAIADLFKKREEYTQLEFYRDYVGVNRFFTVQYVESLWKN